MNAAVRKVRWFFNRKIVVFLLPVFIFVGIWQSGICTYTVLSGSMEPSIPTGSLLFVSPVNVRMLKPQDIITFRVGENITATHRIVSVHENGDGLWFHTKGDANAAEDGKPIHESEVIGSPILLIPGGGYLIWYLRKNVIFVFLILFAAVGTFLFTLPGIVSEGKTDMKKGKYLSR